jgi:phospholipid/cholesterol/gamma-HCH transport system substrate-binding protein
VSSRTGNPASSGTPLTNPVLVGTTIVVALFVGVFLSYNANKGLPFVQTFALNAEVPDAQQLVEGSEVRIGGFRVGQVNEIVAEPAEGDKPPYARLEMKLDGTITGIPEDTIVRVRPRSLLGAKYVELIPGDSQRELDADSTLPIENAEESAELDEIFNTFDRPTREGLQDTIRNFGDSVAGRGPDINRAIVATADLLPPLKRTAVLLADPRTDLDGFVEAGADFAAALAPVADELGQLFDKGAATLAAIDAAGPAFGESIEELPPTEAVALDTLVDLSPVLRDAADLTAGLRAGTRELPRTTSELTGALRSGTSLLRRAPELTGPLDTVLRTLDTVARDPATAGAVGKLTEALRLLQPSLDTMLAAQAGCNVLAVNLRNQAEAVSRGDQQGTWLSFLPIIDLSQGVRQTSPTPGLHYNPYPRLDGTECEAGKEPYLQGTQIGNPSSAETGVLDETQPPAEATRLARSAGLLDAIPGASR